MKKTISLLTLTLLFSTINLAFAEMSCATFSKELDLASWDNQGLCNKVKSTTEHACYNFEADKRNINCNSSSSNRWSCKSGYKKSGESCIKRYIPANAYETSDGWNCFSEYFINRSGSSCQKIPANATKTSDVSFKCNSGYSKNSGGNSCIKTTITTNSNIPENAHASGNGWECDYGYTQYGNSCIKKSSSSSNNIPPNASASGNSWLCNNGFYINSSRKGCVRVPANAFSPDYSNDWYCKSGYKKSGSSCINIYIPPNASASGNGWLCDYNYHINSSSTGCQKVPANAYSLDKSNYWFCISGYKKSGNTCIRFNVTKNSISKPTNSEVIILIIAALIISFFIIIVFTDWSKPKPTPPPKPKPTPPPKPKPTPPPKPKPTPPPKPKPRRFVVVEPKPKPTPPIIKTPKFMANNSLSKGDIETQIQNIKLRMDLTKLDVGFLIPTKTGLNKGIFDATKDLRDFFVRNNIHNYDNHPHGAIHKVTAQFVTDSGITSKVVSFYRPNNKKPFPRLWISRIKQHVQAKDLLVFFVFNNILHIVNNTNDGALLFAMHSASYMLDKQKLPPTSKHKFEQGKHYSRQDIGWICLPQTGRPKGGMWDTGYVRVENNLMIFMNIGVPGRTEHDFNNSVDEKNQTIVWYGKPNSHSGQPTFQKLLNGEITPYFFARWDSDNIYFKFLGIGKIVYWRDGTPTLDGKGNPAVTIELKLTYHSINEKIASIKPKPIPKLTAIKPKPIPNLFDVKPPDPKPKPKEKPKPTPPAKPKPKPKPDPKPKVIVDKSEKYNFLNFDQSSESFKKLISRGIESVDVPTIMKINGPESYETLIKEKRNNNISQSLKSKSILNLENKAISIHSKNTGIGFQQFLIQDKENPLLLTNIYAEDNELNKLTGLICDENAYLLAQIGNSPPDSIYAQLQHQLMITDQKAINYLSYWKGQDCIAMKIDRDDEYIKKLFETEIAFLKKLY